MFSSVILLQMINVQHSFSFTIVVFFAYLVILTCEFTSPRMDRLLPPELCDAEGQSLVCAQPSVLKVRGKDNPRSHKTTVDSYDLLSLLQTCPWFRGRFPCKLLEAALGESKLLPLQPTSPRGLRGKFPSLSRVNEWVWLLNLFLFSSIPQGCSFLCYLILPSWPMNWLSLLFCGEGSGRWGWGRDQNPNHLPTTLSLLPPATPQPPLHL